MNVLPIMFLKTCFLPKYNAKKNLTKHQNRWRRIRLIIIHFQCIHKRQESTCVNSKRHLHNNGKKKDKRIKINKKEANTWQLWWIKIQCNKMMTCFAPTKFNKEEEFWGHKHFNKCNRKENLAKEKKICTTIKN